MTGGTVFPGFSREQWAPARGLSPLRAVLKVPFTWHNQQNRASRHLPGCYKANRYAPECHKTRTFRPRRAQFGAAVPETGVGHTGRAGGWPHGPQGAVARTPTVNSRLRERFLLLSGKAAVRGSAGGPRAR